MKGNPQLASLIREVAAADISGKDKAARLEVGASKISEITCERLPPIPGTEAVFVGAKRAFDGMTPVLVILTDGRCYGGFDYALDTDPSGKTSELRIMLSRLKEIQ